MNEFETLIDDTLCLIRVTYWEPYRPAYISGPPEDCYPEEGGYGEWEVCHLDGTPWPELSDAMTDKDAARIDAEVYDRMENTLDYVDFEPYDDDDYRTYQ